jgi:hypothetical protein
VAIIADNKYNAQSLNAFFFINLLSNLFLWKIAIDKLANVISITTKILGYAQVSARPVSTTFKEAPQGLISIRLRVNKTEYRIDSIESEIDAT